MATWFYTNEKGERIAVTGGQLKGFAKAGLITPETIVETEDGKKARAGKVKGLTFPELSVETSLLSDDEKNVVPVVTEETYGVKLPPPPPSPFTAPMPEAVNTSVADSSRTENPFTAPLPVAATSPSPPVTKESAVANPFTASMSVMEKPADSPFTATTPTASKKAPQPQSVLAPVVEDNEEHRKPRHSLPLFVGLGLLALVLMGVGILYGGGSLGAKKTVSAAKAYVEAVIREEANILDLDSGLSTDDFHKKNSATALRDKKGDGELVAKPGFEHTWKLASELLLRKITLTTYADSGRMPEFKNSQRAKLRELIGLSIGEIEKTGERSSVFDNWKGGGSVSRTTEQTGVNAKDEDGKTQLHRAAIAGDSEKIRLLLAQGADIDAKDKYDNTPLHWAAYFLQVDTAKLLISSGANVNVKNDFDKTPLDRIDDYTDLKSPFFQGERAELRAYLKSVGARSGR